MLLDWGHKLAYEKYGNHSFTKWAMEVLSVIDIEG